MSYSVVSLHAQVRYIFGMPLPRKDTLVPQLNEIFSNLHLFNWRVFLVGDRGPKTNCNGTCCLSCGVCHATERSPHACVCCQQKPFHLKLGERRQQRGVRCHVFMQMGISWLIILETFKYLARRFK